MEMDYSTYIHGVLKRFNEIKYAVYLAEGRLSLISSFFENRIDCNVFSQTWQKLHEPLRMEQLVVPLHSHGK